MLLENTQFVDESIKIESESDYFLKLGRVHFLVASRCGKN